MIGQLGFGDAPWIGARRVEDGAPAAIYRSRVLARQSTDVRRVGFVGGVHVRQTFPSLANANHVPAHFAGAVHHGLNNRIQAWDVTSACQDADIPSRGHRFLLPLRCQGCDYSFTAIGLCLQRSSRKAIRSSLNFSRKTGGTPWTILEFCHAAIPEPSGLRRLEIIVILPMLAGPWFQVQGNHLNLSRRREAGVPSSMPYKNGADGMVADLSTKKRNPPTPQVSPRPKDSPEYRPRLHKRPIFRIFPRSSMVQDSKSEAGLNSVAQSDSGTSSRFLSCRQIAFQNRLIES